MLPMILQPKFYEFLESLLKHFSKKVVFIFFIVILSMLVFTFLVHGSQCQIIFFAGFPTSFSALLFCVLVNMST